MPAERQHAGRRLWGLPDAGEGRGSGRGGAAGPVDLPAPARSKLGGMVEATAGGGGTTGGGRWSGAPAAGLRSAGASRQRVYSEGVLEVRLFVDADSTGARTLVGAVADRVNAGRLYADVPVMLVTGDQVLVQSRTSRFGEFHFELPARRDLTLAILLEEDGRRVDIAIED